MNRPATNAIPGWADIEPEQAVVLRSVSQWRHVPIHLAGTVLLVHEESIGHRASYAIPVELVSTGFRRRLRAQWLIAALLVLFLCGALGVLGGLAFHGVRDDVASVFLSVGLGIGVLSSACLFVLFLIPHDTFRIVVGDNETVFELWIPKRAVEEVNRLAESIEARQQHVGDQIENPLDRILVTAHSPVWARSLALVVLAAIPALVFDTAWLLLLCLIPAAAGVRPILVFLRSPRLLRESLRRFRTGDFQGACRALRSVIHSPDDSPAVRVLMIRCLVGMHRFDDARRLLGDSSYVARPVAARIGCRCVRDGSSVT